MSHLEPEKTPLSPIGLRILPRPDGRGPALSAEPAYIKGLVEVQDEGCRSFPSAALGAQPGFRPRPLRRRRRQDAQRAGRAMMKNQDQILLHRQ